VLASVTCVRCLEKFFGTLFSAVTLKNNFGEQLWGTTLRLCSSIDEQVLKNDSFGE
jgi:hypothetical protein